MTLPDNRIRFDSTKIDFVTDVGVTSQDHDNYPVAGGQARFDHQRMYLIGLLSQQSSFNEPTQKRDGTPWFDLNELALKIWVNGEWQYYSTVIPLEDTGSGLITLDSWYQSVSSTLQSLGSEVCFGGTCTVDGVSSIPIPTSAQPYIYSDSRAFLYVNGQALDPRNVSIIGSPATSLQLDEVVLEVNDTFHVQIRRVPNTTFITSNVVIS